jgi:SH3 domain protein
MTLTIMALLLVVGVAHAQTAYVTDVFEITLRSGPTTSNKILKMLPSSTAVEVLRNDKDWSLVRAEGMEGWVLARYLTRTAPAALQVERFATENETLRARMAEMTEKTSATAGENQALLDRLNSAETELASLRQRYADLEQGSKAYVELKRAHDELIALQAKTAQHAEILEMKNRDLSGDTQFRWFLTGAGVVGASLLLGLVLGRLQRKKTSRMFG